MYVIRQCFIAKWFYDQEFSFAQGISMSPPYVLSSLGGIILPLIYDSGKDPSAGLGYSFGLGAIICLASFVSAILLYILDKQATEHD